MAVKVIYIFYSYSFVLYIVPFTYVTAEHNHGCHQKDIFFFYYVQIHVSQICKFWTEIQVCHITLLVWHTRILFYLFSYVAIVHLLQRLEDVGICWNQHQPGFLWSSQFTNGLKYYLLFQILNLGSDFSASLEYI